MDENETQERYIESETTAAEDSDFSEVDIDNAADASGEDTVTNDIVDDILDDTADDAMDIAPEALTAAEQEAMGIEPVPPRVYTDEETEPILKPLEGILFTMGNSVEIARIAEALEVEEGLVAAAGERLAKEYEEKQRGVRITRLEDSLQMCTAPEVYEYLIRIAKQPKKYILTDVLLESLSIVAYKQPITRAEVEKIRGVDCSHAMNKLVEYGLIEEVGRMDAPGRPILFGTTEDFLRSFGVTSLAELPSLNPVQVDEFRAEAENEISLTLEV